MNPPTSCPDLKSAVLRAQRAFLLVIPLLATTLAVSAQSAEPPPAAPPASSEITLLEVPKPALEGLEEAVRQQLERSAQALAAAVAPISKPTQLEPTQPAAGASTGTATPPTPSATELAQAFGELGHLYHAYELWTPAAVAYENARRLEPKNPIWRFAMGQIAFKRGELEAAATFFGTLAQELPDFVPPRLYLAEIALQSGQAAQARELAQPIAEQHHSPAALSALGRALLAEGKAPEAAAAFRLALEQVPEANRLHYLLGMALRAQGDATGAAAELTLAGPVGVKLPDPLESLLNGHRSGYRVPMIEGDRAMQAGRAQDALDAYQRALVFKKDDAEILGRLAVAQAALGDAAGAEANLRRAVELEPAATSAWMNLGLLLGHRGEGEGALKAFREVLELEPRHPGANRIVGLALAAQQDREGALRHLMPLLELTPGDEEVRFRAAVLLVDLGRLAAARDVLEQGLALDGKNLRFARALAKILAAAPDHTLRQGARALELAEQVYLATSASADLELLAQAQAELGRCPDAAVSYRLVAADEKDVTRRQQLEKLAADLQKATTCRP